jgi:hypothetical protein
VFLGDRLDPAKLSGTLAVRLSARRLEAPPPDIPDQLRDIYRSVYGLHAVSAGRLWTASADKFVQIVARNVNPLVVLRLLAGALGGAGLVSAVDVAHSVVSRGSSG